MFTRFNDKKMFLHTIFFEILITPIYKSQSD